MSYILIGIYYLLSGYLSLITLNIILSWFPPIYNLKFFRFLRRITDAYMEPFHGFLTFGFLDFTPIVGILIFEGIIRAYLFLIGLM